MKKYYKLPISAEKILQGEEAFKINLEQSICQMINLICTTAYREYEYDSGLGSIIWEKDFENIFNVHTIRNELGLALTEAIKLYEKRVELKSLQIIINQFEFIYRGLKTKVKLKIVFKMRIISTNRLLEHIEEFFIGPLSYA